MHVYSFESCLLQYISFSRRNHPGVIIVYVPAVLLIMFLTIFPPILQPPTYLLSVTNVMLCYL